MQISQRGPIMCSILKSDGTLDQRPVKPGLRQVDFVVQHRWPDRRGNGRHQRPARARAGDEGQRPSRPQRGQADVGRAVYAHERETVGRAPRLPRFGALLAHCIRPFVPRNPDPVSRQAKRPPYSRIASATSTPNLCSSRRRINAMAPPAPSMPIHCRPISCAATSVVSSCRRRRRARFAPARCSPERSRANSFSGFCVDNPPARGRAAAGGRRSVHTSEGMTPSSS